jgi:hypothetical protein
MAAGAGQKVDRMGEGATRPGPGVPDRPRADGPEATIPGAAPVTRPGLTDLTSLPPPPGAPPPLGAPPGAGAPPVSPAPPAAPRGVARGVVRQGPGVPATPEPGRAGLTAEDIWRTGLVSPRAPRPRPRWRRAAGSAVTVLLLAAAAVIVFLRFHHAPFAVTGAVLTQQTRSGCTVDVTGKIATSGGAGTVSYQWVIRPDSQPPHPLTQTVIAGQQAVFVTVAVTGGPTRSVTLQVLGPDQKSATTAVALRC